MEVERVRWGARVGWWGKRGEAEGEGLSSFISYQRSTLRKVGVEGKKVIYEEGYATVK